MGVEPVRGADHVMLGEAQSLSHITRNDFNDALSGLGILGFSA
jgi:hypothetical protein